MNYLLFNHEILMSKEGTIHRLKMDDGIKDILGSIDEARLCVVDADVLIAAAVENPIEKKDSILVRKFKELYQHEAYITQDEKIDDNLFQVIGIKEQKVREVYSFIAPEKVETFIPYGLALRNTLVHRGIDLNKSIVFVDDLGSERLLTVFDGLKFSRTRVITNDGEDLLPEIKRSQIDFFKKIEEYRPKKHADFSIIVNNQSLGFQIAKNEENLNVKYLDSAYPALEGLEESNTQIRYRLPEEIFKKRKEIELRKNVTTMALSLGMVAVGLVYFLFNKIELDVIHSQYHIAKELNEQLDKNLSLLDRETYREDLRRQKGIDYGIAYLKILDLIPVSYEVNSFRFFKSGRWNLELSLFTGEDASFDFIPKVSILKNAAIKDVFVNNQPGKHVQVTL